MDINYYKQYEPVFGAWTIKELLGEGSFGKVFAIEREDFGVTYRAALKAITVPQNSAELEEAAADGMDDKSVKAYYEGLVEELVREFALMARLKGQSNVVSYEDHVVVEHKDSVGWDILIRMELLTPLNQYISGHKLTRSDVIRLGIDLSRALELCHKYNIIHRDIKPENIFVSNNEDFKLGDFGIARTVEKTVSGLSKKGTYTYMAPEIYRGESYGYNVDIYSLGIVMYRLLNDNRTPFLPAYPAPITHSDRENAIAKRISGARLPKPVNAEGRLAEIVLKACAYDPKERYDSPVRLRQELEAILYDRAEAKYIYPDGDEAPVRSIDYVATGQEPAPAAERTVSELDAARKTEKAPAAGQKEAAEDATVSDVFSLPGDKTVSDARTESDRTVSDVFTAPRPAEKARAEKKRPEAAKSSKGKKIFIIAAAAVAVAALGAVFGISAVRAKKIEQIETANEYYLSGEYERCVEYSRPLYDKDKGSEAIAAALASSYFELGEYDKAADVYLSLSEDSDYEMKIENLRDYSVCLAKLGRLTDAELLLVQLTTAVVEEGREDVTAYVLGEIYYAKSEYENAAKSFNEAASMTKDGDIKKRCLRSLAETYRELADWSALIDTVSAAVATADYASSSVMYEMLGQGYYQRGLADGSYDDYLESAKSFEKVLSLGMKKDYIYVNAFSAYHAIDSYASAANILNEMEQAYPDSYMPHALMSILLIEQENAKPQEQRNYAQAIAQYDSAAELVKSGDDATYMQQLEGYIEQLRSGGWM